LNIPLNKLLLLKKALYGLKQAPKAWHLTLSLWLLSVGFNRSYAKPCVFWSANTWLYVHVDDIAIFSSEPEVFKRLISKQFKIKDLGETKHLLGMKVDQSRTEICLNQTHYIEEKIIKYGCSDSIPLATPMKPNSQLVKASKNEIEELNNLQYHYRGLVGALNYLSVTTRPNITFARAGPVASGYPAAFSGESRIRNRGRVSSDTRPLTGRRGTSSPAGKVSFQPARHVPR
jgi:hypothetical protein